MTYTLSKMMTTIKFGKHPSSHIDTKVKSVVGFPDGPVVKALPLTIRDAGSIPGRGTKIPHAAGQLSPYATTRESPRVPTAEPASSRAQMPREKPICIPTRESPQAARKTQVSQNKIQ